MGNEEASSLSGAVTEIATHRWVESKNSLWKPFQGLWFAPRFIQ
jgi:hypothetical protein